MKKIIFGLLTLIWLTALFWSTFAVRAPSFEDDFSWYLVNDNSVYSIGVNKDKSLIDNIKCIIYPSSINSSCSSGTSGILWDVIRTIWIALFFLALVIAGIKLLVSSSWEDDYKAAFNSIWYILIWWLFFFWATWLLTDVISIESLWWTDDLVSDIAQWNDSLFFIALSLIKSLAYFIAIILIVVYGFRILSNIKDPEKAKESLKGVWVVLFALVIIKLVDYIYYIAQNQTFAAEASNFIVEIAKIMWFMIWMIAVVMIFYAGFLLFTDQWTWEKMKQAKNIIINILLVWLVLFMFLLIAYQVFAEFA